MIAPQRGCQCFNATVRYRFYLFLPAAHLSEGTPEVPVQVVLPAYLHRKWRDVKLVVTKGRKNLEG